MIRPNRRDAIRQARFLIDRAPVYLDTETTGLTSVDQIVEICIVDTFGKVLVNSLVKPTVRVSSEARRTHNITDEMLETAPSWETLWPDVERALAGRPLGIYNEAFDLRMILQTSRAHNIEMSLPGIESFCIMKLYAKFFGVSDGRRGGYALQSLEKARVQCGLEIPNSHRAESDTLLARAVLEYIAAQEIE